MRIALGLEYRGTRYCGWQTQLTGCAVQNHLERALEKFLGKKVSTTCAGRTDAGVHAMAQVVHLDSEVERDDVSWVRGTNTSLPADIRVVWAKPVAASFHARFSARTRYYRYLLLNDAVESATFHGLAGWFHGALDVDKMREAAQLLVGEHDFSSFRSAECQAKSPVRLMLDVSVTSAASSVHAGETKGMMVLAFRANAFLHHMVRNIVGELVYVGAGRRSLAEFQQVFAARDRSCAAPTFAPDGLYLSCVDYPPEFNLPPVRLRHPFDT
ncbi:MAG: tRNA pseudouridine(38-40) synthase TruA [Betaproteobacteria bacterium]